MARLANKIAPPVSPAPDRGNLLAEPCLGVADARAVRAVLTLPQAFARLSDPAASTVSFTALQAHQAHAWHAFLVQAAAMALHRAGETTPWTSADRWRDALVALADGSESAWTLAVADLSRPAFLQPPWNVNPNRSIRTITYPSELDLLTSAKNHDRKAAIGNYVDMQHWLFSLVSIQTTEGFTGRVPAEKRQYYGIMRMKGGFGNRTSVSVQKNQDLGCRFRSDLQALSQERQAVISSDKFSDNGIPLLWVLPWDEDKPCQITSLDPWVIEICRPIRIHAIGSKAFDARMVATHKPRIIGYDDLGGNVGDPWTPIDKEKSASVCVEHRYLLSYAQTSNWMLSANILPPPCQTYAIKEMSCGIWRAEGLVRCKDGKLKTQGWHEREILIPERLRSRFASPEGRDALANVAREMVQLAGVMRLSILKPALRALWDSENNRKRKDPSNTAASLVNEGLTRLEAAIDAVFFDHLWDHPENADAWRQRLAGLAAAIFEEQCDRVGSAADRWRRLAKAQSEFEYRLRRREHASFGIFLLPSSVPVSENSP